MNFSTLSKGIICLLLLTVVFAGCKKDDDTSGCNSGTMSYKYDGRTVTATSFQNTLFKGQDNSIGGISAKRLDIRGTAANGEQLVLSLSDFRDGVDGNDFRLGKYYLPYNQIEYATCGTQNGVYACVGGLATYFPTSNTSNFYMSISSDDYDGDSTHYVLITENNESAQTISGEFVVAVSDFGGSAEFLITEGEFNDVCYSVIEQ